MRTMEKGDDVSDYIALEELDFLWSLQDVKAFDRMWEQGLSVYEIAKALNRDPDEIAVLAIDRARKGKIGQRKGGAYGSTG